MKIFHQGDVVFVEIDQAAFEEARKSAKKDSRGVVQWGEATGHAHKINTNHLKQGLGNVYHLNEPRSLVKDVPRPMSSKTIVEVVEPLDIEHGTLAGGEGDHNTKTLPPGFYATLIQEEGDDEYRQAVID